MIRSEKWCGLCLNLSHFSRANNNNKVNTNIEICCEIGTESINTHMQPSCYALNVYVAEYHCLQSMFTRYTDPYQRGSLIICPLSKRPSRYDRAATRNQCVAGIESVALQRTERY